MKIGAFLFSGFAPPDGVAPRALTGAIASGGGISGKKKITAL